MHTPPPVGLVEQLHNSNHHWEGALILPTLLNSQQRVRGGNLLNHPHVSCQNLSGENLQLPFIGNLLPSLNREAKESSGISCFLSLSCFLQVKIKPLWQETEKKKANALTVGTLPGLCIHRVIQSVGLSLWHLSQALKIQSTVRRKTEQCLFGSLPCCRSVGQSLEREMFLM